MGQFRGLGGRLSVVRFAAAIAVFSMSQVSWAGPVTITGITYTRYSSQGYVVTPITPTSAAAPCEYGDIITNFSVTATGTGTLSYQWYINGVALPSYTGATTATVRAQCAYVATTSGPGAGVGVYRVKVSDANGSVTSQDMALNMGTPPVVTGFPTSPIELSVGGTLTLRAAGPSGSTYVWMKNGNQISGATSSIYQIPSITASHSGSYSVFVGAPGASLVLGPLSVSVYSSGTQVPLEVVQAPANPTSATIENPKTIPFYITGDGPITYQWYKDDVLIPGSTKSSLSLPRVQYGSAGVYKGVASSPYNSVTATFTLLPGEVSNFVDYPEPRPYGVLGQPLVLSAPAVNSNTGKTVTYQWYKKGVAISGAKSSGYTIPAVTGVGSSSDDTYSVTASISSPSFSMAGHSFRPTGISTDVPTATGIIGRRIYRAGETLKLSASYFTPPGTNGTLPITVTWVREGVPIPSGNDLVLSNVNATQSGTYTATVSNSLGSTTQSIAVQVLATSNPSLEPSDLALVINDSDPYSVAIGEYYRVARGISAGNVIHIQTPVVVEMTATAFAALKAQIDAAIPNQAQAIALAWKNPSRVVCNSITSALSRGFDASACSSTCGSGSLPSNTLYNSGTNRPFTDTGIRPSMLLAADTINEGKALIDRGVASDGTNPSSSAYLMKTSDSTRSLRQSTLLSNNPETFKYDGGELIRGQLAVGNSIPGKSDVMFYFTGLTFVPHLDQTLFLPGAIADTLTSYSGKFDTTSQMNITEFIRAGATGSFGTVSEPCASTTKFPDPRVMIQRYSSGDSLIEAYWKSIKVTFQGLFIGEPLAAPYRKDPYFSNVVLMAHMNGADGSTSFPDVKGHSLVAKNQAKVSTAVSRFGGGSAAFDGTGDSIASPSSPDWTLGAGDWTIELWWNPALTSQRSTTVLLAQGVNGDPAASAWWLELRSTDGKNLTFYAAQGASYKTATVSNHGMLAGNWYHIAAVRSGTSLKVYIDGVERTGGGATLTGPLNVSSAPVSIGGVGTSFGANGFIDDVRITRDVARYLSTFSPPQRTFENQ